MEGRKIKRILFTSLGFRLNEMKREKPKEITVEIT